MRDEEFNLSQGQIMCKFIIDDIPINLVNFYVAISVVGTCQIFSDWYRPSYNQGLNFASNSSSLFLSLSFSKHDVLEGERAGAVQFDGCCTSIPPVAL